MVRSQFTGVGYDWDQQVFRSRVSNCKKGIDSRVVLNGSELSTAEGSHLDDCLGKTFCDIILEDFADVTQQRDGAVGPRGVRVTLSATLRDHNTIGMFPHYPKIANYHGCLKVVGKQIWAEAMCLFNDQVGDAVVVTGRVTVALGDCMLDFARYYPIEVISKICLWRPEGLNVGACRRRREKGHGEGLVLSFKCVTGWGLDLQDSTWCGLAE